MAAKAAAVQPSVCRVDHGRMMPSRTKSGRTASLLTATSMLSCRRSGRSRSAGSSETTEAASTGSVGHRQAPSSAASASGRASRRAHDKSGGGHDDGTKDEDRPHDRTERGWGTARRCHDRPSQQQTRAVEQKWLEDWVPDLDHAEDEWSEDDTRSQGEKRLADGQLPHAPADQRETT